MPRTKRAQSEHNLYHITVKGINQVQLFYDDTDRRAFLDRIWQYRDLCGTRVLSWCLMANHVHLLLTANISDLSNFMKRLLLSYSHHYDKRYDRNGYLYQGRFHSVAIKDEAQLLNVIRYIHRNPVKAGHDVRFWTSFDDIVQGTGQTNSSELLSIFSDDMSQARKQFIDFVTETRSDEGQELGLSKRRRISDEEAAQIIVDVAGTSTCQALCDLDAAKRNQAVSQIRMHGLSIRQIARLTGLNRGIVQRAGVSRETSP